MLRAVLLCLLVSSALGGKVVPRSGPVVQNGNGRIIGGSMAGEGEFPSQAALTYMGNLKCGCSIINEKYVLTTARCVQVPLVSALAVHAGSNHLTAGGRTYQVGRIHVHELFNAADFSSPDIAVVSIRENFVTGPLLDYVALPAQAAQVPERSPSTVVGWGFTAEVPPVSPNLLKVDLVIRTQVECKASYASQVTLSDDQICADVPEGGKGVCEGDFGGALFVDNVIQGIASWSQGCAAQDYPGVYTRVASFRSWIDINVV